MLLIGWLLLSKVPPVREMVPALVARPLVIRSLLPVEAERREELVRVPERMRVPSLGEHTQEILEELK